MPAQGAQRQLQGRARVLRGDGLGEQGLASLHLRSLGQPPPRPVRCLNQTFSEDACDPQGSMQLRLAVQLVEVTVASKGRPQAASVVLKRSQSVRLVLEGVHGDVREALLQRALLLLGLPQPAALRLGGRSPILQALRLRRVELGLLQSGSRRGGWLGRARGRAPDLQGAQSLLAQMAAQKHC